MAKCRICKTKYDKSSISQVACSVECAIKFIDYAKEKKQKKKNQLFKAEFRKKDVRVRESAAQKACHDYIRERDKGGLCVCCDAPLGELYHAGHFYESGRNSAIRYDADNIHGQTIHCNKFRGGDSGGYRLKLIKKIGVDRVERLDGLSGPTPIKRNGADYKKIEKKYKELLKSLLINRDKV